ncbi:hypothetical protein Cpir12675_003908 [Ceratocystis pirilliformis]|uniref:Uncharacterized protein n=1 Tax=Ceratocystis pirilliformis TaxID=259994 RepID=A0ABR3YZT7_9PEZI
MRFIAPLALLALVEISAASPLQPKASSSSHRFSVPVQTHKQAPEQTPASNVLSRPALPLLGGDGLLGDSQEPSKTKPQVIQPTGNQDSLQPTGAVSSFAPDCYTVYAPYANATRTRQPEKGNHPVYITASAPGSLITAAPSSSVICRDSQGNKVTNANTVSQYNVFYGKVTSVYTYPNGDTCTLLPQGEPAVVVSYYKEPNNTVTFTGSPEEYTAPYKNAAQPTWCNFLLTPTPIAFKTGGFIFSIDTAMANFNVLGSATTSTIYAVDHNPSVIFARSATVPNFGLPKTSVENDHLPVPTDTGIDTETDTDADTRTDTDTHTDTDADADEPPPKIAMGAAVVSSEENGVPITLAAEDPAFSNGWKPTTIIKPTPQLIEGKPQQTSNSNVWHLSLYTGMQNENQNQDPTETAAQDATKTPSTASFAITAGPDRVIINDKTYEDLGPKKTSTITYNNEVFVVEPDRIVHEGGDTMARIRPGVTGLVANISTSTVMNGLDVVVNKGTVRIGDYVYTIGPTASTEIIMGQEVVIGPTGIALEKAGKTLPYTATVPEQTEVVVAGGKMITAYGNSVVVIHQTTITYKTMDYVHTTTIDDNVLYIGRDGVVIDGTTTLGGPSADVSAIEFAIVGGVTLTQIGSSELVVLNETYTVGPNAPSNTTITAGGQTITIDAHGAVANSVTLQYPFGPSMTTTIVKTMPVPGATTSATATKTQADSGSDNTAEPSGTQNNSSAGSVLQAPALAKALAGALLVVVLF